MTIKEYLIRNKIPVIEVLNCLDISCPFCNATDIDGAPILSLQVNENSGRGNCQSCRTSKEFLEIIEALGIKDEIECIENGVIRFSDKDNQKQRQYAPEYAPAIETKIESEERFTPISLKDLYQMVFPEVQWLVEGLIPLAGLIAISGIPGSYKSWLIEHLAVSVANNTDFLERFKTLRGGVLIVDEEDNIALLQSRLKQLGAESSLPIYFLSQNNIKIDQEEDLRRLKETVKKINIRLIMFDSLVRIHNQDENTSTGMSKVFEALRYFTKENITVVFTHHHRKNSTRTKNDASQSLRGSSDILAAVDCHLAIEEKEELIIISQTKLRSQIKMKPFKVAIKSGDSKFGFKYIGEHDEIETKKREIKEAVIEILSNNTEELSFDALWEQIDSPEKLLRDVLKELTEKDKNEIACIVRGHNKKFYSIKGSDNVETSSSP